MLPEGRTFNKSKNVFSNSNYGAFMEQILSAMRLFAESGQVRARSLYLPPVKQDGFSLICRNSLISLHKLTLVH